MRASLIKRGKAVACVLGALLCGFALSARAEVPFVSEGALGETALRAQLKALWALEAAQTAFEAGLVETATRLAESALAEGSLQGADSERLQALLGWLYLLRGRYAQVDALLAPAGGELAGEWALLAGYRAYYGQDNAAVRAALAQVNPAQLAEWQRGWWSILRGLLLAREGAVDAANAAFLRAEREAATPWLVDHYEYLRQRNALQRGEVTEQVLDGLRDSARSLRGERAGFEAVRLLAIALTQAGRGTEALSLLSDNLSVPGLEASGLRRQYLLLMGLIGWESSARARLALRQLVDEGVGDDLERLALWTLSLSVREPADAEAFVAQLSDWLERPVAHPLTERMLLLRARQNLQGAQVALAEADMETLLEDYPGSPYLAEAYQVLAQAAWQSTPPRWRAAADYLNRARAALPASGDRWQIGVLIAHSYYLNGDYLSASEAYAAAYRAASDRQPLGEVLFFRVMSLLALGEMEAARSLLDRAGQDLRVDVDNLWQAEWNFVRIGKQSLGIEGALARIAPLLQRPGDVETVLWLRMNWLSMRLQLEAGEIDVALRAAVALEARLLAGEFDSVALAERDKVIGHLRLLQGEAQLRLGQRAEGIATLQQLRNLQPGSGPAILSYLVEARYAAADGGLVTAQQSLIELADRFPDSEFAPVALWEAALSTEQRGLDDHLREAIAIHERLVQSYPQHGLAFHARLRQSDLARRLNDFATARILIEQLLREQPRHPQIWRAELSLADTLVGLGSAQPELYEDAEVRYERLVLLPETSGPVRIEAGYKWVQSLRLRGQDADAQATLWMLNERFQQDQSLREQVLISGAGRFWISRILWELAQGLERAVQISKAQQLLQQMIELQLPGWQLAAERSETLSEN